MSRNQAYRLAGELELQALQNRIGYRGSNVQPSPQSQYAKRGEMVDLRPLERDVLHACLDALPLHPSVSWFARMNVGALEVDDRTIRFAFKGCSDIIGMLKLKQGSKFLAIECKAPGKEPTDDQAAFLFKVWNDGGCAFVANDASDVFRNIPR